jgi:hypothetical protein
MTPRLRLSVAVPVVVGTAGANAALALKPGGILETHHRDSPAVEATIRPA